MQQKKLYVGSLAWATTSESLEQAFSEFGQIEEAKVIFDRETNRSRGFGFVTFASEEDAQKAMESMNGAELDGRNLRVNIAEDKPRREFRRW